MVKRDLSREPFDPEKIRSGIERACWKRPISTSRIQEILQQLESEINDRFDVEISSEQVGELVMKYLASIDEVALIRFASVYRDFKQPQDFIAELQPYLSRGKSKA